MLCCIQSLYMENLLLLVESRSISPTPYCCPSSRPLAKEVVLFVVWIHEMLLDSDILFLASLPRLSFLVSFLFPNLTCERWPQTIKWSDLCPVPYLGTECDHSHSGSSWTFPISSSIIFNILNYGQLFL